LIASFRLVASVVVSPSAKLVPVFVPLVPPLREVAPLNQVKPALSVFPSPILFPPVPCAAVTVTVLVPPVEAVTPRAGKAVLQRIIRLATFVAKVVVVLLVANTGVDNDEQAPEVVPFEPAVGPLVHEKTPPVLATVRVGDVPGFT